VALAKELFDLMESKAHDEEFGGYLELFPPSWSRRPEDLPPGGGGLAPPAPVFGLKQMNTHLHLMEPMTTYYEVTGDDLVRARLLELSTIESNAVVRKDLGACTDRYARDWTPLLEAPDRRVSYGHDIENVWLLVKANAAAGLPDGPLVDLYRTLFRYSMAHGWDAAEGGFYDSGPLGEDADRRGKTWWVQAEGLAAALHMYRLTGDEQYYDVFEKTLDWIMKKQADWEHGDWHDYVGERAPGPRAGPWKSPYHNGRAVLECLELLDEMR